MEERKNRKDLFVRFGYDLLNLETLRNNVLVGYHDLSELVSYG